MLYKLNEKQWKVFAIAVFNLSLFALFRMFQIFQKKCFIDQKKIETVYKSRISTVMIVARHNISSTKMQI